MRSRMYRMNNSSKKIFIGLTAVSAAGILAGGIALGSCSHSCDGISCRSAVGLSKEENLKARNTRFSKENPSEAVKLNVFVESSASMDGYVNGNTRFKTLLHRLIGQLTADVMADEDSISLNYVNSKILNHNVSVKEFTGDLSAAAFRNAGGDRGNSNIIDVVEQAVRSTDKGTISMLLTDCVYSPQSGDDIDKALQKQQTDMLNVLKRKFKKGDETFGVLLYRMSSDFNGVYYTKTNQPIQYQGERPYFVWIFGDESLLASVYSSTASIMAEQNADCLVGIPGYKYLPYKTEGSDHPYHYMNAKANSESAFTFTFVADMNYLPLPESYILNPSNYTCGKHTKIKKIERYKPKQGKKQDTSYNYKYTVSVSGGRNAEVTPMTVEIAMKSMTRTQPEWITTYDDPKGTDFTRGQTTFGLKSLADGVCDFYSKYPDYVTFKIKIN